MIYFVTASIRGEDYQARGRLYVNLATGTLVACVLVNMYLKQVHVDIEEVVGSGMYESTNIATEVAMKALSEGRALPFAMSSREAFIREPLNLPLPWFMFTRYKEDYETPRLYF